MTRLLVRAGLPLVVVGTALGGFGLVERSGTDGAGRASRTALRRPVRPGTSCCSSINLRACRRATPMTSASQGAEALLTGLSNAGVDATLTVAGFGNTVTDLQSFDLPAEQSEALAAIEAFRNQDTDRNTDYVLAMLAAVKYFESSTAPPECRTLMWFTDGAYDLELATPTSSVRTRR